jgi:hypothetical protein
MAGETTTTALADSIYAVVIGSATGSALSIPMTYNYFVFAKNLEGVASNTWRSIVRDDITDAVSVAEAADVTDAAMGDEKAEISVDTIGRSVLVTYEAATSTVLGLGELAEGTRQVIMSCRRKMDSLLWTDTSPNLTNSSGDNSTPLTYAQFVSFGLEASTQWKDTAPPGSRMRVALHSGPFGVLVNDMITSEASIFAATFGSTTAGQVVNSMGNGGMKVIGNTETFVTDRIPAADTTGKGNVWALVGGETGSAFGLAFKWAPRAERRATEKKLADRMIGHARIGFGILRQEFALLGITAAA